MHGVGYPGTDDGKPRRSNTMGKRTVTTSVRRAMRAAGVETPKAKPGERTEAEKAASRAQRKPKADRSAPNPTQRVSAPLPSIPATPVVTPVQAAPVTAPQALVTNVKAANVAVAIGPEPVQPNGFNDVSKLGRLEPGVELVWDKAGKPTLVTYTGRDERGRVLVAEIVDRTTGRTRTMALPAWLLSRKGA